MNKLKELRRAAGLTQVALAQRAKVSRWRLVMAETEALELRPDEVEALRQILKPELVKVAHVALEFQIG